MHETDQERDFNSIVNTITQLGEIRDKTISEIGSIIDRLKENRNLIVENKTKDGNSLIKIETAIIPVLRKKLSEMEDANGRLILICNRLNELA